MTPTTLSARLIPNSFILLKSTSTLEKPAFSISLIITPKESFLISSVFPGPPWNIGLFTSISKSLEVFPTTK